MSFKIYFIDLSLLGLFQMIYFSPIKFFVAKGCKKPERGLSRAPVRMYALFLFVCDQYLSLPA